MCGICGTLRWNDAAPMNRALLESMNGSIVHRGPDDEGYFLDSFKNSSTAGSIGLAMRRLSIIDLAGGHQPITNETGDVIVVYNGETYNFLELRAELKSLGHRFETHTDTEVLVHGYEEWGDAMPERLNGMFGFALWDKRKNRLLLARDRMGIKPMYYAISGDRLSFGSEIKSILRDPEISRDIDHAAIDDYLSMRYIPTPRSAYRAIRKLEPGTLLIWENGQIRFQSYWRFEPKEEKDRGLSYYLEKVDALLQDAVQRQLISDVPLGTFLSGGIDSPAVTYYAKKAKKDLLSFTIYFAEKSFSEREEAKAVARYLATNHVEKEVTPNIVETIPHLVNAFDEPFGDDSMIPTYFLTKLARQRMTVALSGDGGDELFGGYPTYIADRLAVLYRSLPKFFTRGMIEPVVHRLPSSFQRVSLDYKAKAFVAAASRPSPLEHFGWTEIFRDDIKKELYSPWFLNETAGRGAGENYVRAFEASAPRKGLERFLFVDQKTHLLDEFLVKVDRLSMANSLEVRPPFLDHRLVEFAAEIPMRHKIRGMTTKYLLRRLMKGRLPDHIVRGGKKGFSPPTATWLVTDLWEYAQHKFSPGRIKDNPYLNPKTPIALLEMHRKRRTNLGRRLWALLMFVEWYDRKILNRD